MLIEKILVRPGIRNVTIRTGIEASYGPRTGQETSHGYSEQCHTTRTQVSGQTNDKQMIYDSYLTDGTRNVAS